MRSSSGPLWETQVEAPARAFDVLKTIASQTGLTDLVGGPDAFEQGIYELEQGCLPLIAELLGAERRSVDLSDAVFLPDSYPHLTRFHGSIHDVCVMECPALLLPWVKKLLGLRLPNEVKDVRRIIAEVAIHGSNQPQRIMAQLLLFEVLCINQRAELLRQGVKLEKLGGRRQDIEVIAQVELEAAIKLEPYGDTLLKEEDPLENVIMVAFRRLDFHIDLLREELHSIRDDIAADNIEKRHELLDFMERLMPDEALIVYNDAAKIFDGEQVTAEQMRTMHPLLLGNQSRDALYQKVHRLPEKIHRIKNGELTLNKQPSLLQLILESDKETT